MTASRARSLVALLTAGSTLAMPVIARGAASYSITLQGGTQTSASPLRDSFHTATPGVAPTLISEDACALPAHVGARARLQTFWPFEIVTGISGNAAGHASTDDFLIAGPPGVTTVSGAMRFHAEVRLERGGGLAGSDMHIAKALVHVTAATFAADGSCWSGNLNEGADGVLTGQSPPDLAASFSLAGTFPVGVPFAVSMNLEAEDQTYGDSAVSPGITATDGWTVGLALGDTEGPVMDLPDGYTVNAPSWGVIANHLAGVDAAQSRDLEFAPATPNPSAAATTFEFTLPHTGSVSLVVTDLQGRRVRRLAAGPMSAGPQREVWEGRDESGGRAAPGIYFGVLRFENRTITRRVVRIR